MAHAFRICIVIIGICLLAVLNRAYQDENPVANVVAAEASYQSGQYTQAAAEYKNLIDSGYTASAALYFNLGNAYFEDGQIGLALVNYLRAQRLQPRDGAIERNIVRVRANRVLFQRDEGALVDRLSTITVNSLRMTELAMLGFVTWNVFFVTLVIAFTQKRRRYWQQALIICGVIAVLANSLLFVRLYTEYQRPRAVVTRLIASVYSGPNDDYLRLFDLQMATELRVLDQHNNWLKIILPDGRQGWVRIDTIEKV